MPIYVQKAWFTEEQILSQPKDIFLFGDNEQREGTGGQAKPCRGKENTHGIRTKRKPKTDPDAYWTDETFRDNVVKVIKDFDEVYGMLAIGLNVYFPADGFGTGLALLSENAPRTLAFIKSYTEWFYEIFETHYV